MNTLNINTVEGLMEAAASALEAREPEIFDQLQQIVDGWMQTDRERMAQTAMLTAMSEAAYELQLD
jgi:hypothetical protein